LRGSFRIGRVGGIDIRLHFTFLLVLPIIAVGFSRAFVSYHAAALDAGVPPERIQGSPLFWGAMVAIALFGSVLLHELAHAFVAIRTGGKVRDITLLMIGGVSNLTEMPREPKDEALMALVGPIASVALAALFYVLHLALGATELYSLRFALFYLAALNLILGLFNLIPAFPMDGGRILRGLLATRMGAMRATRVASVLGKVFAVLFALVGVWTLNFFLLLIAFFIYLGAEAEAGQVALKSALGEVRVTDLVRPAPQPMEAWATVEDAAGRMVRDGAAALLVRRGDGTLGVVVLGDVERIRPEHRAERTLAEIVREAPSVPTSASLWDALHLMMERGIPMVAVQDGPALVGTLTQEDVMRNLRLRRLQRTPPTTWTRRERTV
jgi:Zn-dependent protease/CBS domain-containing protein